MSPTDEGTIRLEVDPPLFRLSVLDGTFREIAFGFGTLERAVPPGLYLARCEFGGAVAEEIVKVSVGQMREV
jgi:hypothetical protein